METPYLPVKETLGMKQGAAQPPPPLPTTPTLDQI